jgi:hypothetical protein
MFWSQTRKQKKLEKERRDVLDDIRYERWQFELMAQRAQAAGEPADSEFLKTGIDRFDELESRAVDAKKIDEFDYLVEKAEGQGTLRAYICPTREIVNEGSLAIDVMAEWGIPKTKIETLRNLVDQKLMDADIPSARGALRAIFDEKNSWGTYTDDYEDEMRKYTIWLVCATIGLLILAGVGMYFRLKASSTIFLAILLSAGAAGSCVSVMRKMPLLDVGLSAELDAYGRRIWSRVATGTVASLVGCALLSWGVLPIAIQGQTFSDVVSSCTAQNATLCTIPKTLIFLAVAILFGFSERTLTSVEQRVLGGESEKS